jgi:Terpene cyclase DEP1
MRPRQWYLGLCVLGTVLPYSQFIPFLRAHGLDLQLFWQQLFANRISGFFGWDVMVSSLVLWVFVYFDGRRLGVTHLWAPIVANLAVGVSLGLPLFLYLREGKLENLAATPLGGTTLR